LIFIDFYWVKVFRFAEFHATLNKLRISSRSHCRSWTS